MWQFVGDPVLCDVWVWPFVAESVLWDGCVRPFVADSVLWDGRRVWALSCCGRGACGLKCLILHSGWRA